MFKKICAISALWLFLLNLSGCTPSSVTALVKKLDVTTVDMPSPDPVFIEHGSRKEKMVALTFDADMTPLMKQELDKEIVKNWYNKKVIDILRKRGIPSTIFITGMWAEIYPDVVKDLASDPLFEIGNHSYDHAGFTTPCFGLADTTDKEMEITKTQQILTNLTGKTPVYFRFPGGCHTEEDLKLVAKEGMQTVQWDVISGDAFLKDYKNIVKEVLNNTQNGSIIVMHLHGGPHTPATAEALDDIITLLSKNGYKFVKISDLMANQE